MLLGGRAGWKPALPLALFAAVGDPEDVVELLRVARVGVVGAFVFVFDIGAGGLHGLSCFAGGVGSAAFDGATGGFWIG